MTTANPQPNEHPVQQHGQHDLKRSACAALPSSPPSSPPATAPDHAIRGDDGQSKDVRDDSARSPSSGETAVNTDTPTAAAPESVPAARMSSVSVPTEAQARGCDQISSVTGPSGLESSNARDPPTNANARTAPEAIARGKPAHSRSVSANAAPSLAYVTKSAQPATSSSSVLPTPPGSAMPSPPILVRGASRLSVQQAAQDNVDCVREHQSGGRVEQVVRDEDKAGRVHDGARGQSGAATPGQASAEIAEAVPAEKDQEQVPDLKSWSSPCADRYVLVVGPSKSGRKLNRAVSWHETVKTPGRVPPLPPPSSAPLADQDPAPTAPPMYLELDLESTPLARARPLAPPAPAAPAPAVSAAVHHARAAPLKAGSKRKRSRSPSPPALSQSAIASSSSHPPPLAPVPRPYVHPAGPRRVHTLPAPPSALSVSPTKALEWLQWAEDKENIDPADWLRQYEAKKKYARPGDEEDKRDKGMAGGACNTGAGGYGGGGAGGAASAVTVAADRRSRNSAPSASASASSSSSHSSTTLSTLASRSINAAVDPHAKCDQPPTKRLRTGYATSAAAASGSSSSSSSTLVSLCLASSPMRPVSSSPASSTCGGAASAWLARRPVDASVAAAADSGQSSPVAAALMMRLRNSRAVIR